MAQPDIPSNELHEYYIYFTRLKRENNIMTSQPFLVTKETSPLLKTYKIQYFNQIFKNDGILISLREHWIVSVDAIISRCNYCILKIAILFLSSWPV